MDEAVTIFMYIDTPTKVDIFLFIFESIGLMKYLLSGVSVFLFYFV